MDNKDLKKDAIDLKLSDGSNMQDVASLIEGILQQTQDRFQAMSDQVLRRIDEMAKRVDDLEKNITDLMAEAGVNADSSSD